MGLVEATKTCLNKFATFEGRARRSEFWYFYLAQILAYVVVLVLAGMLGAISESLAFIGMTLYFLLAIALILPTLAAGVRRLHDIDRSGWWYLIGFVPLVGAIVLLVFFCTDSTPGDNQFGPNPKGMTNSEVFS